jgi:alkylation response protein AidB-like acyl-CoA dehydrogenase
MRAVAAYATDVAVDVVTRSYRYAGGSALYRPGVLQRCLRDINAAAQHFMVSSSAYENYGASLLDLPDINPMA